MITAVVGFPGSGKSLLLGLFAYLGVIKKPLRFCHNDFTHFQFYDKVYTNFSFQGSYKLDFDELGYADFKNCLILCDEIQLFADSRNFKNFGDNLKFFFSEHRKNKIDFIYATQNFDDVDKRIRSLTEQIFYIDRAQFGYMRVRRIDRTFDETQMKNLTQFCPPMDNMYFKMKKLYHLIDSMESIGSMICRPVDLVPWENVIYHYDFYPIISYFPCISCESFGVV